jgi:deazaflavin-dependent oxidoreductase (nitroreductase family)
MKAFMRLFIAIHVGLYRLTGGKMGGSMRGSKVLLLTTTGRKSGKQFTVPLGFTEQAGSYTIVASNGGQPTNPGWYLNLKSKPQATVQIADKTIAASAEILTGEARDQAWTQFVAAMPSYANYQKKAARTIPVVVLRA